MTTRQRCLFHKSAFTYAVGIIATALLAGSALAADRLDALLRKASSKGDFEQVKELVARGADVNAAFGSSGFFSDTPLQRAAEHGHLEIARFLLEHGAKLEANDRYRGTPLIRAAMGGHRETVRFLLDSGAKVNATADYYTPLMKAASKGHLCVVGLLVERDAKLDVQRHKGRGQTALMLAAKHGHEKVCDLLVEKEANVNLVDQWGGGNTALMYAAYYGHVPTVEILLKHGADARITNWKGETAIDKAKKRGHSKVEDLLSKAKDKKNDDDR